MSKKSTETGAIRKQIVRNTEETIRSQPIIRNHIKVPSATRIPLNEQFKLNLHKSTKSEAQDNEHKKYRHPELSSTLGVAKRLEALKVSKPNNYCKDTKDMTPKSKLTANTKVVFKI